MGEKCKVGRIGKAGDREEYKGRERVGMGC